MTRLRFDHGIRAKDARRVTLIQPEERPGFVAWVTAFTYGDGRVGMSYKQTFARKNPFYQAPRLEMGEAVAAPVSYGTVECGSPDHLSQRVYCVSEDQGKTWKETGRCRLEEGSFCNFGYPDGRIVGLDVPHINQDVTGWEDCICVRESMDGGSTWKPVCRLLEGCAPYIWRTRRLKDGTGIVLASMYGTPWGQGRDRMTRNTQLPGESYIRKIQTFFLTTKDGLTYSGPHYILPGVGAHEYDVAECEDGRLLFIAGDVQATPVARQFVRREGDRYINGTLYGIRRGAPESGNVQGGFVPESIVMLPGDLLVGSRRNRPYTCSNDYGENWYEIAELPTGAYQPYLALLANGTVCNFGHIGGDNAFGQVDMAIVADLFCLEGALPSACRLTLERCQNEKCYLNRFRARLTAAGKPVAGQPLTFRAQPYWNPDGSVNMSPQEQAETQITVLTNADGVACAAFPQYDGIRDIHFSYNIDVVFRPSDGGYASCDGPCSTVSALTPHRRNRFPYDAYFAEGKLFLSAAFRARFPDAAEILAPCCGVEGMNPSKLPPSLREALIQEGVLQKTSEGAAWLHTVHAPCPLDEVLLMENGDWYE